MSPSMILYARQMKDTIPCHPSKLQLRKEWVFTAKMREQALSKLHLSKKTELLAKSRLHKPLAVGDVVQVQNQRGNNPNKWDNSATVVEVLQYDSYLVKMDSSGRVSKRNRQFLKPIVPFIHKNNSKLPNQTYNDDVIRTPATELNYDDHVPSSNHINTG